MPYIYRCTRCAVTSRRYSTNHKAQCHGHDHRQKSHGGDHPDGETVQRVSIEQRQPAELVAAFVIGLAIFFILVTKLG